MNVISLTESNNLVASKKVKILQLMHSYEGFTSLCNEYSRAFAGPRFAVTVAYLVGRPYDDVRAGTVADRVIFFEFSSKDIRGVKVRAVQKLLTFCKQEQFDIVFCHRYKPTYVMSWVNLFCPVRKLFSIMHGLGQLENISRKAQVYLFCRRGWKFVGISDAVSRDLLASRSGLTENNVVTVHNAIDVQHTVAHQLGCESARKALNIAPDDFVFGTVGRLSPDKDHRSIIRAFRIAREAMPRSKMVIVGSGRLEEALRAEARKQSVENEVVFSGNIPQAFRIMPGFDVFLLSSTKEGFGLVLLEAMAARRPIIGSTVGGIPEVLGASGVLVPPGNPEMLAEKMIHLYRSSPEERQKLGDAGYARLVTQFTSEQHHAKVLSLVGYDAD